MSDALQAWNEDWLRIEAWKGAVALFRRERDRYDERRREWHVRKLRARSQKDWSAHAIAAVRVAEYLSARNQCADIVRKIRRQFNIPANLKLPTPDGQK